MSAREPGWAIPTSCDLPDADPVDAPSMYVLGVLYAVLIPALLLLVSLFWVAP